MTLAKLRPYLPSPSACRDIFAVAALVASLALGGCAVANKSLSNLTSGEQLVTNSVVEKTASEGVDKTDAEIIKAAVSEAPAEGVIKPLAWRNPDTGSSGTIVAIDKFMGKHGQDCRGFKTSVTNFTGISLYNGETCQISPGQWVLSWFKPSE